MIDLPFQLLALHPANHQLLSRRQPLLRTMQATDRDELLVDNKWTIFVIVFILN